MSKKTTIINQENVRQKFINYLNTYGVKLIYVATKIDIPYYILSQFKFGRNVWNESLLKLDKYLDEHITEKF